MVGTGCNHSQIERIFDMSAMIIQDRRSLGLKEANQALAMRANITFGSNLQDFAYSNGLVRFCVRLSVSAC